MAENQNIEWKESWRDEYLKWICGFANAQGGILNIGINDDGDPIGLKNSKSLLEDIPNKIVTILGIVADVNLREKNGIEYIEIIVPKSNMPIAYKGTYHYRSGSTKQELKGQALQNFLLKKLGLTWDDIIDDRATINDIDPEAIIYFQKMAVSNNRMMKEAVSDDIHTVLDNLNLINDEGKIKKAALLLFGKDPAKFVSVPHFRLGRFRNDDTDLIFQDSIECDLIRMADRVIEVLKSKYLVSPIHYEGLQRIENLELPEDALREAIFNAIIHKDYTGAHIQMKVWDDRIELWNDGGLPYDMTIDNLLSKHSSKPRNPNIASVFYKAGFIESWGRGILKIQNGFKEAGLKPPVFEERSGGILVTMFRYAEVSPLKEKNQGEKPGRNQRKTKEKNQGETRNKPRRKTGEKIIELIIDNPKISQKALGEMLNMSKSGIEYQIKKLKEAGILERVGGAKGGYWVIKQ